MSAGPGWEAYALVMIANVGYLPWFISAGTVSELSGGMLVAFIVYALRGGRL